MTSSGQSVAVTHTSGVKCRAFYACVEPGAHSLEAEVTGVLTDRGHLAAYRSHSADMARPRAAAPNDTATETRRKKDDYTQDNAHPEGGSARMSLLILVSIFLSAAFIMFLVYKNFPQLSEEERQMIKVPRDMDDAKALGKVLSKYKDTFYVEVLVAYFATYVFLQTFAIPGSIFLSILSGFLYPFPLALFLVCLCSGLGASFCYTLSYHVGRPVVYKYLTEKAVKWSQQVERHRDHLINYIIFLRITPFLPNWFINITSPIINVPLKVFFWGTFLGVAPPSFVAIKAGTTLYQLTTAGEAVSWNSVIVLMILAVLSILPAIFQNKLKKKFE
ncbi:transmembrane protein 41B [Pelodytes ibericus]